MHPYKKLVLSQQIYAKIHPNRRGSSWVVYSFDGEFLSICVLHNIWLYFNQNLKSKPKIITFHRTWPISICSIALSIICIAFGQLFSNFSISTARLTYFRSFLLVKAQIVSVGRAFKLIKRILSSSKTSLMIIWIFAKVQ